MTKPTKPWKPAVKGTTKKYAGILGFPDLEGEKREQLIHKIAALVTGYDDDLMNQDEIADDILKEIEK